MSLSTTLLIKRSTGTATPTGLQAGELAYSYLSNTLFIGDSTGTAVANVGGLFYTQQVDAATASNTASTIVRRDANNAFFGRLYGNANTATALESARNFSISGGDITASSVSFDGTGDVTLSASLNAVPGLTAGVYGGASAGSTQVPIITVASNGRIMAVTTEAVGSTFTITDGSSSNTVYSGSTLTFTGSQGVTATVNALTETVTFGTDDTVLRSNTYVGTQTIATDLNITGNLVVSGSTTTVDTSIVKSAGSLYELAANNTTGDVIDIGFYGNHDSVITGLVRDASTKDYYLFDNVATSALDTVANTINTGVMSSNLTTLHANVSAPLATITQATITTANVSSGMTVNGGFYADSLAITGGINVSSVTDSGLTATRMTFAGTGGLLSDSAAITTDGTTITAGGFSTSGSVSAGSITDTGLTATRITFAGTGGLLSDSSAITTDGTTITAGGFSTSGSVNAGGITGTSVTDSGLTATRMTFAGTGGLLSDSASITTDGTTITAGGFSTSGSVNAGAITGTSVTDSGLTSGRVTFAGTGGLLKDDSSFTFSAGTLSVSSLTLQNALTVPNGGTGATSFTSQGIVYGNGTGALQVTAAAGTADVSYCNQLLTVDNSGNPVWTTTLDGGTF